MDAIKVTKAVAGFVIKPAINHIVTGAIATNVPQSNVVQRALVFYGKVVIASIVGDYATKHVNMKIDEVTDWISQNVNAKEVE